MHLTEPNICAPTKIVQLNEEQVNSFMVYASRVGDRPPTETSGVPLPFGVNSDARRLTIEQAVSENIYREYGQLSREWESNRLYMIR